jgi:hypothetical protein
MASLHLRAPGHRLAARLTGLWHRRIAAAGAADRGDVPGWVLVTMMTAGLVAALWAVAGGLLTNLFQSAVSSVSAP